MKKNIILYLFLSVIALFPSCIAPYEHDPYYYLTFSIDDGYSYYDFNENNGSFNCDRVLGLFEDYWQCYWDSADYSFDIYCEPAPDSGFAIDPYLCDIYFTDYVYGIDYYSVDGFDMTAWYSSRDSGYEGYFNGDGIEDDGVHPAASMYFYGGTFLLPDEY
jgi:hypothetical protein